VTRPRKPLQENTTSLNAQQRGVRRGLSVSANAFIKTWSHAASNSTALRSTWSLPLQYRYLQYGLGSKPHPTPASSAAF
jgi:hypothetical protein